MFFFSTAGGKGPRNRPCSRPRSSSSRAGRAGGLPQRGGPEGGGQPRRHGRPRKCRLDGAGRDRGGAGSGAGQGPRRLRRPRRQQMAAGLPPPQGRWEFPASEVRRSGGSRRCRRGCRCGCVVVGGVIPQMCRLGVLSVVWGCVKERREGRSPPRPPPLAGRESYLTAKMPSLQQCVPL